MGFSLRLSLSLIHWYANLSCLQSWVNNGFLALLQSLSLFYLFVDSVVRSLQIFGQSLQGRLVYQYGNCPPNFYDFTLTILVSCRAPLRISKLWSSELIIAARIVVVENWIEDRVRNIGLNNELSGIELNMDLNLTPMVRAGKLKS
jgi:hypothetical protein